MNRGELRLAIRQRADMVGSEFVSDSELDLMIDSSVGALDDLLTAQFGNEYFARSTWIQTVVGANNDMAPPRLELGGGGVSIPGPDASTPNVYALPKDFCRLVRVQFFVGTITQDYVYVGSPAGAEPEPPENWKLISTDKRAWPMHALQLTGQVIDYTPQNWTQTHVAYRLRHGVLRQLTSNGMFNYAGTWTPCYTPLVRMGTAIEFLPVPLGSYAVQIEYVPTPQLLTDHPFEEYIVFDCAALCLEKQRSDSSVLRTLQSRVVDRLQKSARTVDAANPPMVVDVGGYNGLLGSRGQPPWL